MFGIKYRVKFILIYLEIGYKLIDCEKMYSNFIINSKNDKNVIMVFVLSFSN